MVQNLPNFSTFQALAAEASSSPGRALIPMFRRLFSDTLTPVLAYRRLVRPDARMAPSFLLESVVGGSNVGRYSYLGAQPIMEIIARDHEVELRDHQPPTPQSRTFHSDDPLGEMNRITASWKLASHPGVPGLPDFTGGWVGYAGYDTVRYLEGEKIPSPPPDDRHLPDLHMQLYMDVVAFDHVSKTVLVITHVLIDEHESVEAAYAWGEGQLDALAMRLKPHGLGGDLDQYEMPAGHVDLAAPPRKLPVSTMGEGGYQRAVEKCKKYIQAGDVFQVVPSQRFDLVTQADPFDIYRALRVVNPSPYMFYLQIDGGMLVGSSPEILCRVQGDEVVSRPLAGTRRRGKTDAEDKALEAELLADPKDRAEHIMLVDLHRNDVGRVAVAGTIELPEILTIERFSHVMHLSSQVTGKLREGCNAWDVLRVSLPVGTVSGAPKVRAMQIIDELEPRRRGPYAGAVGYADFAGNLDMAIALRTMVVLPGAGNVGPGLPGHVGPPSCPGKPGPTSPPSPPTTWRVHIQAGGGIVADSDPDAEHQETVNKAAALAKAIDVAEAAFTPPT